MSKSNPTPTIDSLAPVKRCYACNSPDVPKRAKIDGFTEALCLLDYGRFQRGEALIPFGCEPVEIKAEPLTAEQVDRDLAALKAESVALLAEAARKSASDVAAIEATEAKFSGKGRVKVARVPVVTPTQKPAPAPVAAPIQVVDVVAPVRAPWFIHEPAGTFILRPDADTHPELCRRLGCDRPPVWRGVCGPDHSHLSRQGMIEQYCAPSKLVHNTFSTLRAKIVEIVAKNEGISAKKVADILGVESKYCSKAVAALRKQKRLATPKCNKSLPEYMMLYVRKP